MAFEDLDEELDKLRGDNSEGDVYHSEFDDSGELESESLQMDWNYVHPNAVVGNAITNSTEGVEDALRWVLQDKNKKETANYWEGAGKLGIDLFALGVSSGSEIKTAPSKKAMGNLYHTLGIQHVTQGEDESVEEFLKRKNDTANFDVMKSSAINANPNFTEEFSFPDKSGKKRVGALEAIRGIAKGYVDAGALPTGKDSVEDYEKAVDAMEIKVAKHLPHALQNKAKYFADKISNGEKLEFGDSYASVLKSLPVGATFSSKSYGDTSALSHNLKGIGEVFGAIHTGGRERQDLTGIAGWKEQASAYAAGDVLDELYRSGDEDKFADVAKSVGASMYESQDVLTGLKTLSPETKDIGEKELAQFYENREKGDPDDAEEVVTETEITQEPKVLTRAEAKKAYREKVKKAKADEVSAQTLLQLEKAEEERGNSLARSVDVAEYNKEQKEEEAIALVEAMPTEIPKAHWREGDENLVVSSNPQGTEAWHKERNSLLTAADAGLVNDGKYSAAGLKRKMDAASGAEQMSEMKYNAQFARGHAIEPQARKWYEKEFGDKVTEMGLIQNPTLPGLGVSVDGLVGTSGLFESKAPAFKFSEVSEGHAYYDQVQMQMAVTGRDWADLVQAKAKRGYVPRGEDPLEYDVVRHKKNDAYIEKQLPKWNKLARDVRIAGGISSIKDDTESALEHRPKQQEDDFESRLNRMHERDAKNRSESFEDKLAARMDSKGRQYGRGQSGKVEMLSEDAVRDGVLKAEEELQKKKQAGGGGSGGFFDNLFGGKGKRKKKPASFLGGLGSLGSKSVDVLGQVAQIVMGKVGDVAAHAGRGDFVGAAGTALRGIPVVGGALAGGLEAVQGMVDRTTDYATNIGDAKVMGVDFNNLNNTQRTGTVYGITQEQSSSLMQTTSSAAQNMSTGDASGASKIVVATRGFVTFSDIQQYGEEPLRLANIAIGRMTAAGLTKGQQSALLRNAGLGSASKLTDTTEEQNELEDSVKTFISPTMQRSINTRSGKTNSIMSNMKKDFVTKASANGGLEVAHETAVKAAETMETGAAAAVKMLGGSTKRIEALMSGSNESLAEITNILRRLIGLPEKKIEPIPKWVGQNGEKLKLRNFGNEVTPWDSTPAVYGKIKSAEEVGNTSSRDMNGLPYAKEVAAASKKWGVPKEVLFGMIKQESGFNNNAVSSAGAKGLVQYLDKTAKSLQINPKDPEQAIDAAAMQIRGQLDKGWSLPDAVRHHHGGPNRAIWGKENDKYVKKVMDNATIYGGLGSGNDSKRVVSPNAKSKSQDAQKISVEVSVNEFTMTATAKAGDEVLSRASRRGQPTASTI